MADATYTMATWKPFLGSLIASDPNLSRISLPFAVEWGGLESDGNPCAIGSPAQLGPDGFPREIGLGQLYNPDDFARLGVTPAPYRAYCIASTPAQTRALSAQYVDAAGRQDTQTMRAVRAQLEGRSRALTNDEMIAQARDTLLRPIAHNMAIADADVAKYKLQWSMPDYWKLVKAPHALPGILNQGLPAVVAKLGRAPSSWAEFRTVLGMNGNDQWNRALNVCEACGNATALAVS